MPTSSGSRDYGRFDELAEEFAERYRRGERPSLEEYIDRCPDLADEIREMFPALVEVEQVEGDARAGELQSPAKIQPLKELGDYRIVREIGHGGMGVVYEAEQVSLGRRVALKVLPRHVAGNRKVLERFRREAKAAARLHHTNIVPVFEVGQEGDVAFYTMQFIQGQGLDQVIDELARLRGRDRQATGKQHDRTGSRQLGRAAVTIRSSDSAASGLRSPALGQVAESLLSGRLATDWLASGTGPSSATTETAGPEPFSPSAIDEALSRAGSLPPPGSPAVADASNSAVLPGGTTVTMAGSSRRRPPFFRSVAQIGRQAAQGLAYAHSRGIVHRDIKPSNLLLDTAGVVWITDFGLAKAEDDGLTATGDVLGTLRYMAPERFRGEGNACADTYALGLTLYELLTLEPAFESSDRLKLIERIKGEEPVRPRSLDDRIPRDLETIVLKAIDKDPKKRYASSDAMAEDLRRFLDDEPIQARRASAAERYARWVRRHPGIAALGAALTAVLALTTLASLFVAERMANLAQDERNAAQLEHLARREADQARAASEKSRDAAEAETYQSVLSEVRALRAGHQSGWRDKALGHLARLAKMPTRRRDLPELRTEAAATLGTADIRLVASVRLPADDLGSFTFSPDGRTLVTAGRRTGLEFWDVPGRAHLSSVEGLAASAGGSDQVAYLPDGRGIAVGTRDHGVVFTDTQGIRTTRAPITRGGSQPKKLALSTTGDRLAIAWTDGSGITVHDAASGAVIDTFSDAPFALSPDGRWLARYENSAIVLVPIATHEPRVVVGRSSGANALAFSRDGAMLASFLGHTVVLWDVLKSEQLGTLRGHREQVYDVAFSPDGDWIATSSLDYTVRVWETRTGQNVATLSVAGPVRRLEWSPRGDYLATCTDHSSQEVRLYKITGRRGVQEWLTGHHVELRCVAAHPRLDHFATSGYEELMSWDLAAVPPAPVSIGPNPGAVTSLAYSPDGSLLAAGSWLGSNPRDVVVRDATTGKVRVRLSSPHIVFALAFDRTGGLLACGDQAGNVVVWDLAASRAVERFMTGSAVRSVLFLDRPRGLVAHGQNAVFLFNLETGKLARKVELAGGTIETLAADRARERLVVGFESGAIASLSLPDLGAGPRVENAHNGSVDCLALSPDGRLLATGGADHRVVLREATTLAALLRFPAWAGSLRDLTFDSKGTRLIIVGTEFNVSLWDLAALHGGLTGMGLAWDRTAPTVDSRSGPAPEGEQEREDVTVISRPDTVDPASLELARALVRSGVGAYMADRRQEAIADLQRARDRLRALNQQAPGDLVVASQLGVSLGFLGSALRDEHRPLEALEALEECRQVLEAMRQPSFKDLYNLACVYAGLSISAALGQARPASAEHEAYADRALELLRRSLAAGMTDFALMDRDHDLDPLRGRSDFRALMFDRGFPSSPFAN